MYYIPTSEQRIKIYTKLKQTSPNANETNENNPNQINTSEYPSSCFLNKNNQSQSSSLNATQQPNRKKAVSKEYMDQLVNKLAKNTKRDYVIKEQVEKICKINLDRKKKLQSEGKVQERLIRAGIEIQKKKQKMREQQQKKQYATLQPTPNISERAKNKINAPFMERIDSIVGQKQDLIKKLNEKYDPLFKPKLNPYSLFIAEVHNSKGFLQRVEQHEQQRKQSEAERLKQIKKQQMKQATFKPQINQKSKSLVLTGDKTNKNRKSASSIQKFDFKPQINNKSRIIALMRQNASVECHERLYDEMRRISLNKMNKRKQDSQQHTYKPQINRKSLKILQNKQKKQQNNSIQIEDQFEQVPFYHQNHHEQLFPFKSENITESYHDSQSNQFLEDAEEIKFSGSYVRQNYGRSSQIKIDNSYRMMR